MDKHMAWDLRDLATEYLDIELQLTNEYLADTERVILETRQDQIADQLQKIFDDY
jgi:hypothetical protein